MKELEILLDQYWVIKDDNKDLFYQVKDSIPQFKTFLSDKLGYRLLINQHLIKLEKFPVRPSPLWVFRPLPIPSNMCSCASC